MTVGTEQFEVALVGRPVLEATAPCPLGILGLYLPLRVDVVDVQGTGIVESATGTLSAEGLNDLQLAFPVSAALVNPVAFSVPVGTLARRATESCFAWLAALMALARLRPARLKVAVHRAELATASTSAWRRVKRLAAMLASAVLVQPGAARGSLESLVPRCLFWFAHTISVAAVPTYCKIAVRRVRAELERFPLFEQAARPRQLELLDAGAVSVSVDCPG
jgi:hypothetical protein